MRDDKGRFIVGHQETEDEKLKRIEGMRNSWKNRKDYIGDIVNECPKLYNMWRSFRFTEKGKSVGNCEQWNDFRTFYNDVRDLYFDGACLRRKDKTLPFQPDNIMFLTKEQCAALQEKIELEYDGERLTLKQLADKYGKSVAAIRNRYHKRNIRKYSIEEIIFGRKTKRHTKEPTDKSKVFSIRTKASKMISSYKVKDFKMGVPVCDIDIDWMIDNILNKPCYYCGDTHRVGCDRIDNNLGHTKSNVVPCCYECNCARNRNFSFEEMVLLGKTIAQIKKNRLENG